MISGCICRQTKSNWSMFFSQQTRSAGLTWVDWYMQWSGRLSCFTCWMQLKECFRSPRIGVLISHKLGVSYQKIFHNPVEALCLNIFSILQHEFHHMRLGTASVKYWVIRMFMLLSPLLLLAHFLAIVGLKACKVKNKFSPWAKSVVLLSDIVV